jgi:tRNA G18 (ribose-2'-O)-methylase SpoU
MKSQDYFVRHEGGSDRVSREEASAAARLPFYGILDRVRSAHNVGSMFRTADGANAAGLFLCGYTPTPPHRHLAKTALGAVDVVPWQYYATVDEAILAARSEGAHILAVEHTTNSLPLFEFGIKFPIALVMGNEVDGLSEETIAQCDAVVHLPMHGLKNSLNVSVAFGITLYEVLRRYEIERTSGAI